MSDAKTAAPMDAKQQEHDSANAPRAVLGLVGRAGPDLSTGRAISVGEKGVQVLTEAGRHILARRAAACLLDPEPGDTVLVYSGGREAWVLSVLEKSGEASRLSFPGDVSLTSPGRTAIAGKELDMAAVSGSLRFVDVSVASRSLRMSLDKAVCLARTVESTVGDLVERLGRSFRQVSGIDTLHAGAVRQFIKDRFYQRSANCAILAEEKVKVDADKIELG